MADTLAVMATAVTVADMGQGQGLAVLAGTTALATAKPATRTSPCVACTGAFLWQQATALQCDCV